MSMGGKVTRATVAVLQSYGRSSGTARAIFARAANGNASFGGCARHDYDWPDEILAHFP